MTTQSLFGPNPTLTFLNEAEAIYAMALRVLFGAPGTIPWIRFWNTTTAINTEPFAAVYQTNGTLRYSQSFGPGGLLGTNQWIQLNLTTPVPVAAGETLDITVGPRNRYAGASGVLPRNNGEHLSASGSFFEVSPSLIHPDANSSALWFGIDVGFDALIAGTLQSVAQPAQFAGTGLIVIRGSMAAVAPPAELSASGGLVIAGTLQAAAPAAQFSASQFRNRPGILTPGGTFATLTTGGTSSTLTASGQP